MVLPCGKGVVAKQSLFMWLHPPGSIPPSGSASQTPLYVASMSRNTGSY